MHNEISTSTTNTSYNQISPEEYNQISPDDSSTNLIKNDLTDSTNSKIEEVDSFEKKFASFIQKKISLCAEKNFRTQSLVIDRLSKECAEKKFSNITGKSYDEFKTCITYEGIINRLETLLYSLSTALNESEEIQKRMDKESKIIFTDNMLHIDSSIFRDLPDGLFVTNQSNKIKINKSMYEIFVKNSRALYLILDFLIDYEYLSSMKPDLVMRAIYDIVSGGSKYDHILNRISLELVRLLDYSYIQKSFNKIITNLTSTKSKFGVKSLSVIKFFVNEETLINEIKAAIKFDQNEIKKNFDIAQSIIKRNSDLSEYSKINASKLIQRFFEKLMNLINKESLHLIPLMFENDFVNGLLRLNKKIEENHARLKREKLEHSNKTIHNQNKPTSDNDDNTTIYHSIRSLEEPNNKNSNLHSAQSSDEEDEISCELENNQTINRQSSINDIRLYNRLRSTDESSDEQKEDAEQSEKALHSEQLDKSLTVKKNKDLHSTEDSGINDEESVTKATLSSQTTNNPKIKSSTRPNNSKTKSKSNKKHKSKHSNVKRQKKNTHVFDEEQNSKNSEYYKVGFVQPNNFISEKIQKAFTTVQVFFFYVIQFTVWLLKNIINKCLSIIALPLLIACNAITFIIRLLSD